MELNFEVYHDNGDMVAQIQVFDDGSFWIKNDEEYAVAVNEVEEDEEEIQMWHDGALNIDAGNIVAGKGVTIINDDGVTRIDKNGVTHTN